MLFTYTKVLHKLEAMAADKGVYFAFENWVAPEIQIKEVDHYCTARGFHVGPRKIPHFGLVFVNRGSGWAVQAGRRCALREGAAFLVFPGVRYSFGSPPARFDVYSFTFSSPSLGAVLGSMGLRPRRFVCESCDRARMRDQFERMLQCAARRDRAQLAAAAAALWTMLEELSSGSGEALRLPPLGLRRARERIDEDWARSCSVAELADIAALSRHHFMRAFKKAYGVSPRQYQIERRLDLAKERLAGGATVKEVAHGLGYLRLSYFSRVFKCKTGLPPTRYARQRLFDPVALA